MSNMSLDTIEELTNTPNFKNQPSLKTLDLIATIKGPIVEVGGTTHKLIDPELLPHKPITTNRKKWGEESIDLITDGKALPFADKSIPMIMADHISLADLIEYESYIHSEDPATTPQERQGDIKEFAKKDYRLFIENPDSEIKYNLRINIMREINRVVEPGGIVAFGALNDLDMQVAETLGWSTIEIIGEQHIAGGLTHYDVVFQKPTDSTNPHYS